jgi:hypothetical protein
MFFGSKTILTISTAGSCVKEKSKECSALLK